ncbi:MAG: DoxX family membrane protein [Lewinellaceae bacterium]|nr:DoxX family membrane protein [Saprospiraceae bacterium]MCB0543115.1 DoxX family membrane protein [Saprospiraceae bacterium]MCB9306451.1 DoxX family membrane protein [Lewinellaceae bacterium]MCB9355435.1 DoxX family membrane protein [Lewinellaceae bacterium]
MNAFLSLGRWLFPVPFLLFGLMHFMDLTAFAHNIMPNYVPAPEFWVLLTGTCLVCAAVSMYIGKYDKLATALLAVLLLLVVALIDLPSALAGGEAANRSAFMVLKDLGLAAAAMLYATHVAKDPRIINRLP